MSWKKIPTSTIFNLKKLKKKSDIIDSHSSMLLYFRTSEGFRTDSVWIQIQTANLPLWVAAYLATDVSVWRNISKFMDVWTLGDGTEKLSWNANSQIQTQCKIATAPLT